MPATIQTIEKPKRARALDTSTSEQETYDIQTDGTFTATDETNWTMGDGVSISGNYMVFEDVGGNTGNAVQGYNGTALRGAGARGISEGDRYRVQATISDPASGSFDGKVRIVLYSAGRDGSGGGGKYYGHTSYATSATTIDEIVTVNGNNGGGYNDAIVINASDDPGDYRVSNLKVTKLESFDNNNHGQIYSGRALEFDGVSDYLSTGLGTAIDFSAETETANKAWTIACWVNRDSDISTVPNHITGGANSSSVYCAVKQTTHELTIWDFGASQWREGKTALEKDTWYRAVWVFDGIGNIKFYLNGVDDTDTSDDDIGVATTYGDLRIDYIGAVNTSSRFWSGKLSDFQAWQGAWTADDALFDYLNPEQLALNRGGTSLTRSNLKIWYPMNDGHRGQQSYILDASNTGLGDSILSNGDFSNGTTGWSFSDCSGTVGTYFGESNVCKIEVTSKDTVGMYQSNFTKVGQNFKYSFDYYIPSTNTNLDAIQLRASSSSSNKIINSQTVANTWTSVYAYYTPENATVDDVWVYLNSTSTGGNDLTVGNSVYVKNIKIEPVNGKNHATTAFKGDELITVAKDKNLDASNNWDVSSANWSIDGNSLDYDGSGGGSAALDQTYPAFVVGRTYEMKFNTSASTIVTIKDGDGSNTFVAEDTYSSGTKTVTFVAPATTDGLMFTAGAASGAFAIDWINVKELGIATGWTDADQQLDIPQTALQSYNQLAWWDGESDTVVVADTSNDHDDIWGGGGSVSAWIYPYGVGENNYGRIVDKSSTTDGADGWNLHTKDDFGGYCKIGFNKGHSTTDGKWETAYIIAYGKWYHVVVSYNQASASNNPTMYINGEEVALTESQAPVGAPETDASQPFTIGNRSGATDRTFDGTITEVSLWGSGLSADNVKELYNDGKALSAIEHSTYLASPGTLDGYWRNNGLSQWTDLSDNSNHGTISCEETMLITAGVEGSRDSQGFLMNRQRTTNSLNNALGTSGIKNYVEMNVAGDDDLAFIGVGDGFSVSVWVKKYQLSSANQMIVSRNNNVDGWRLQIDSLNKLQFAVEENNNISTGITDSAISTDTWYHMVGTFDGDPSNNGSGVVKLYINGVTGGSTTNDAASNDMDTAIDTMYIGKHTTGGDFFNGEIDDLCIYDKVLTAAEVKRNYNAGKRSHR